MKQWFDKTHTAVRPYTVRRIQDSKQSESITDQLAEEVPIAFVYNGISHAVMLASPQDLEDFALGFSITEGILNDKSDLYDIDVQQHENGIEVHLNIANECFMKLKSRRRSMAGRTGCGLCGTESLAHVFRLPDKKHLSDKKQQKIEIGSIFKAYDGIKAMQTLQKLTGATHACAWADHDGNIQYLREDVGRHNALDKLLGALCKAGVQKGFILTTSRASYEMVQKLIITGFDILAAISAPTGLAIRIADAYDVAVLGFVREHKLVAYTHEDKIDGYTE